MTLNVPRRWTRITSSHSSALMLNTMRGRPKPALFTTTSMRPHSSTARRTSASPPSPVEMSWASATASPPAARISPATSSAGVSPVALPSVATPRSLTTTFAPYAARRVASARPMPRPLPVTTATLPLSGPAPRTGPAEGVDPSLMSPRSPRAGLPHAGPATLRPTTTTVNPTGPRVNVGSGHLRRVSSVVAWTPVQRVLRLGSNGCDRRSRRAAPAGARHRCRSVCGARVRRGHDGRDRGGGARSLARDGVQLLRVEARVDRGDHGHGPRLLPCDARRRARRRGDVDAVAHARSCATTWPGHRIAAELVPWRVPRDRAYPAGARRG